MRVEEDYGLQGLNDGLEAVLSLFGEFEDASEQLLVLAAQLVVAYQTNSWQNYLVAQLCIDYIARMEEHLRENCEGAAYVNLHVCVLRVVNHFLQ